MKRIHYILMQEQWYAKWHGVPFISIFHIVVLILMGAYLATSVVVFADSTIAAIENSQSASVQLQNN